MSQVVGLPSNSYKPINNTAWIRARLCKLQKGRTRLAAASDKVYQLLAHDRWFSPGIPATSTTKTGRHGIVEILLKVALKHQKSKSNQQCHNVIIFFNTYQSSLYRCCIGTHFSMMTLCRLCSLYFDYYDDIGLTFSLYLNYYCLR